MTKDKLKKILDDWGFQYYIRHCQQQSKDDMNKTLIVHEEWNNEQVANLIMRELGL